MPDLNCLICCQSFNDHLNVPRMLHCGHTICSNCICNILETSKHCPICRKEINTLDVNDFLVNYIVLELRESRSHDPKENFLQLYQKKLENRQEEHKELRTALESLKNNIDSNLGLVKSNEERLTSLQDACDPFNRESVKTIKEVDERFDDIRGQLKLYGSSLINTVTLRSNQFSSSTQFFQKLHEKIVVENRKVVAMLRIDGLPQGAKLSFRDDLLFINAFERSQEEGEIATTVCFQDLQDVLLRRSQVKSIYGFLDLYYRADSFSRRVLIEIENATSSLGSQFLKLCTGELGISYKGREYDQGYSCVTTVANGPDTKVPTDWVLLFKDINWSMEGVNNYSVYFLNRQECWMDVHENSCYLSLNLNGSFEIFKYNNYRHGLSWENVVGTVVDVHNNIHKTFHGATYRKIANCGIALKF